MVSPHCLNVHGGNTKRILLLSGAEFNYTSDDVNICLPGNHWSRCGLEVKKSGVPWPPRPLRFLCHCVQRTVEA